MNFINFYLFADVLVSESFEGVSPPRNTFSDLQWYFIRNAQKIQLTKNFDDKARKIFMSRHFRKPIQYLKDKVQAVIEGKDSPDSLKYVLHSSHDTQLINVLDWLAPSGHFVTDQPYASTVFFELHYDSDCLSTGKKDHSCFTVEIYNNGMPLKLDTCITSNKASSMPSSPVCQFDDFIKHIEKRWYKDGDLDNSCYEKFLPYPFNFLQ